MQTLSFSRLCGRGCSPLTPPLSADVPPLNTQKNTKTTFLPAAYQLVQLGSEVVVLDENATWEKRVSDSSYGLSPHTCGRVREMLASGMQTPPSYQLQPRPAWVIGRSEGTPTRAAGLTY